MKKLTFTAICLAFALLSSCARYVDAETGATLAGPHNPYPPSGSYGNQGGQMTPGGRSLKPYYPGQKPAGKMKIGEKRVQTGTKKVEIAYFEARLQDSEDASLKQQASNFAARYFEKHRKAPSDEEVSEAIGHKCHQVRQVR